MLIHYNALYSATNFIRKNNLEENRSLAANDIIHLATQIERDEVDVDNVPELVYSYETELINEELMEVE
jgi:hypothetical protein